MPEVTADADGVPRDRADTSIAVELPLQDVEWGILPEDVAPEARTLVSSYLSRTDEIGAAGGVHSEWMSDLVTPTWFPRERQGFDDYVAQSIRTLGTTHFDHLEVQSARITDAGELEVTVFVCVDSSKVLVFGTDDADPPESLREWLEAPVGESAPDQDTVDSWEPYLLETGARTGFREPIVIWLLGEGPDSLLVDGTENWRGANPC
jgi:hypothetical protein